MPLQEGVADVHVDSVSSDHVQSACKRFVCSRWKCEQHVTLVVMIGTPTERKVVSSKHRLHEEISFNSHISVTILAIESPCSFGGLVIFVICSMFSFQ